ncbi:uncharacterized protein OCT59_004413 [Rhizophagus irregularis]|uniref:Uncharacterized protein n=1 Tax=Rhizophagus irregularis (strain DAOM 197198w) TaxID=1432141 RepID=A0A015ICL8_RHIIW|nr:hypothetical protein RirG_260590 [Rhizophagus irregularis DAOM 197198w]UZO12905.1 hypothetical protein OCT59_004413 [Rhizophagus irregularis]
MNTSKHIKTIKNENARNLWKESDDTVDQLHVTISSANSTTESEETCHIYQKVNFTDLEKRKKVYGICGECNEPRTGEYWCQPCNAKRFEANFKNWTNGNKNIDELI